MKASVLVCAVGASFACCGFAQAQMQSAMSSGKAGSPMIAPAEGVPYSNPYDGISTFGNAAQIFEPAFSGYDIWLGDNFETSRDYNNLELSSVGFCGNGCIDPFLVQDFFGQIWNGTPCNPGSTIECESVDFAFNGIDTWTAIFGDRCLPAGDYFFIFAARNDFGTNGQTYFFQQTKGGGQDDGFQWNPNGAFGFPGNCQVITEQDLVTASSPNAVINGNNVDCEATNPCDLADCNDDGNFNILDFVCFQSLFQDGDPAADCNGDGNLNILDFVCFQSLFQACPEELVEVVVTGFAYDPEDNVNPATILYEWETPNAEIFEADDQIILYRGLPVSSGAQLNEVIESLPDVEPGEAVEMMVLRDGLPLSISPVAFSVLVAEADAAPIIQDVEFVDRDCVEKMVGGKKVCRCDKDGNATVCVLTTWRNVDVTGKQVIVRVACSDSDLNSCDSMPPPKEKGK